MKLFKKDLERRKKSKKKQVVRRDILFLIVGTLRGSATAATFAIRIWPFTRATQLRGMRSRPKKAG